MPDDVIHGDPECQHKHFAAAIKAPIDPDAAIDVECFMSTDSVDADEEVMLPDGIDLSRFTKNPVVMLCHAMGQPGCFYPLPVGKALWTKQAKRGVLAGVRFARDTEMGRQVKALFDEGMLRSFSVGFRPLHVSMMTRKEADSRPDWKEAFDRTKGQVRVHRKWLLVELSVAPIPSNPDALVTAYKAKGIVVPSWLNLKTEAPMADNDTPETPDSDDPETKSPCDCGKSECKECAERMQEHKAEEDDRVAESTETAETPEPEAKAAAEPEPTEASPEPEPSDPDDFDEDDEAALPIKTGDHVDVKSRHFRGCGVVEKIHRKGLVDHVDEDMIGTKDDPAARVRLYKQHGDGHRPSEQRRPFKLKELARRAERFKEPSKKSLAAKGKGVISPIGEKSVTPEPLPTIVVKSDQEVRAELIKQLQHMLSPEGFRKIAREEAERAAGFV